MDRTAARAFDAADAARMRPPIGDLVDVVRSRIHRPWTAAWQSPAAVDRDATSALTRLDGLPWGPAPASTVLPVTQMLLEAVVQHVQAVQVLLEHGGDVALPIDVATRAALEAAGQLWWLLEPGIGGRARVARLYAQRRATAEELEQNLEKMGEADVDGYGAMPADLDRQYRDGLGLAVQYTTAKRNRPSRWDSCEGQQMPNYTTRVGTFVRDGLGESPEAGYYAFYCGASHSELWRLQYGYIEQDNGDGTATFTRHAAAATLTMAAAVSTAALIYSADAAYRYVDDRRGQAELAERLPTLRRVTRSR